MKSLKNFMVWAVLCMAMGVVTLGVSSCSKDEEEEEKTKTEVISGAQEILNNMQIHDCSFFERIGYVFYDVIASGEPNSISLSVTNSKENDKEGCSVSCSIIQNYRTAYTFKMQFCEQGHLTITDTGKKDKYGKDIKSANIYIPKMYDTDGNVVKELRLKYEGTMEVNGMLEY